MLAALMRQLVGRTVDPLVGDLRRPGEEPVVERVAGVAKVQIHGTTVERPIDRLAADQAGMLPVAGIRAFPRLVLSHPHRDHVELLPDVLAGYQVREVWNSGAVNPICGYRAFLEALRVEPGLRYPTAVQDFGSRTVSFPAKRCYGRDLPPDDLVLALDSRISEFPVPLGRGASMTFLHADGSHYGSFNENSLVVRLDLGGTRILVMGDAETGAASRRRTPLCRTRSRGRFFLAARRSSLPRSWSWAITGARHRRGPPSSTTWAPGRSSSRRGPRSTGAWSFPTPPWSRPSRRVGRCFGPTCATRETIRDRAASSSAAPILPKIGTDEDGRAGGCDNVQVAIDATGTVTTSYWRSID